MAHMSLNYSGYMVYTGYLYKMYKKNIYIFFNYMSFISAIIIRESNTIENISKKIFSAFLNIPDIEVNPRKWFMQTKKNNTYTKISFVYEKSKYSQYVLLVDITKFSRWDGWEYMTENISQEEIQTVFNDFYTKVHTVLDCAILNIADVDHWKIPNPVYILWNWDNSTNRIFSWLYNKIIPKYINIISFWNADIAAVKKQLAFTIRWFNMNSFGIDSIIQEIDISNILDYWSEEFVNLIIINRWILEKEITKLISTIWWLDNIVIADNDIIWYKEKRANVLCQILFKAGSNLWNLKWMSKNIWYVGIDLWHDFINKKTKICLCLFDSNGNEIRQSRTIHRQDLNEKIGEDLFSRLVSGLFVKSNIKISENNRIVLHRDWLYHIDIDILIAKIAKNVWCGEDQIVTINIAKSWSCYYFAEKWSWLKIWNKYLLNTVALEFLWNVTKPLKIEVNGSQWEAIDYIKDIYYLSRKYSGDSIYWDKKLPKTIQVPDQVSSFDPYKLLRSHNR